jgi:hypothetical protein
MDHPVPKGWTFPKGKTTHAVWDLWHYGEPFADIGKKIRPYKNISPKSDLEGVECRRAFSRTKTVFNHIETVIRSNNLHPQGVHRISDVAMRDCTPIFDQAFNMVMERLYGSNTSSARRDELSIETIYNVIVKKDDGTIVKKRPKRPVAAVELEGGI